MIAEALLEQGAAIPEDLLPVEVWPVAEPYRQAFRVLSASRSWGMSGPLPLPYSEIIAYARANGLAESMTELEECVSFIQAQDSEYLVQSASKLKQDRPAR